MLTLKTDNVKTILCIGAHSDDIEIGCGGTVLTLLNEQKDIQVHWVVLSAEGSRRDEAQKAADIFLQDAKSKTVEIKNFTDTRFEYQDALRIKDYFRELSQTVQPDLVFTHRRADVHQDHRFVGELTWQTFRNHMILEYEIPKYEGDLGQPSVFVAIDSELAAKKVATITEVFETQKSKPWFDTETLQSLMRLRGVECQSPSGKAEGFYCRKLRLF
ncbi:MAG: PIG-L deacetylase family protein [Filomicrobium sp.]